MDQGDSVPLREYTSFHDYHRRLNSNHRKRPNCLNAIKVNNSTLSSLLRQKTSFLENESISSSEKEFSSMGSKRKESGTPSSSLSELSLPKIENDDTPAHKTEKKLKKKLILLAVSIMATASFLFVAPIFAYVPVLFFFIYLFADAAFCSTFDKIIDIVKGLKKRRQEKKDYQKIKAETLNNEAPDKKQDHKIRNTAIALTCVAAFVFIFMFPQIALFPVALIIASTGAKFLAGKFLNFFARHHVEAVFERVADVLLCFFAEHLFKFSGDVKHELQKKDEAHDAEKPYTFKNHEKHKERLKKVFKAFCLLTIIGVTFFFWQLALVPVIIMLLGSVGITVARSALTQKTLMAVFDILSEIAFCTATLKGVRAAYLLVSSGKRKREEANT